MPDLFDYPIAAWAVFAVIALGAVLYFVDWLQEEIPSRHANLLLAGLLGATAFDLLMEILRQAAP